MEILNEVCDTCGKKHRLMIKRNGMVFGDRQCFLDFCNSVWLQWENEEFQARGLINKKDSRQPESSFGRKLEKSAVLFMNRAK
jgi:hypothetical protein